MRTRITLSSIVLAAALFAGFTAFGQRAPMGISGKKAPPWKVSQWHNLPAKQKSLDVGDFKGKVLYLYGFQSWCPGCHSHGFPTLKKVMERYKKNDEVAFRLAVQNIAVTIDDCGLNSEQRLRCRAWL